MKATKVGSNREKLRYVAKPGAKVYHLMISVTKVEGNLFLCGRRAEAGMHWSANPPQTHERCAVCQRALRRLAYDDAGLKDRAA
jgi:hypothetical protein